MRSTAVLIRGLVRQKVPQSYLVPSCIYNNDNHQVTSIRCVSGQNTIRVRVPVVDSVSADDTTATDEWVAPDRPLIGDLGQTHLYVSHNQEDELEEENEELELKRIEQELEKLESQQPKGDLQAQSTPIGHTHNTSNTVDWLATRRSKLSDDIPTATTMTGKIMKVADARQKLRDLSDIVVKKGTFLSSLEIQACLESLGGNNVTIAETQPGRGNILVTANTNQQLRSLADTLVRQMRRRDLHLMGVVGAELGVEGADDPNETWFVVDAGNYVVHLQDAKTRKAINLEALWFGTDGLRRVNANDEEAVEDYIAENPVPGDYNVSIIRDWDETMRELQKQRWTVPHRPVVPRAKTKARRRFKR